MVGENSLLYDTQNLIKEMGQGFKFPNALFRGKLQKGRLEQLQEQLAA
jgi:hypothetical protein